MSTVDDGLSNDCIILSNTCRTLKVNLSFLSGIELGKEKGKKEMEKS